MRFIHIGVDELRQRAENPSRFDDVEMPNEIGFITLFRAVRRSHAILAAVVTTPDGTWDTFTSEN